MSHGNESTRVIAIAFLVNLAIALSKFVGAFVSGSASLLAEAIHSTVDCSNQILLLIGSKKSTKKPDAKHPLGYGREAFFWSFIVALLLFSMGGLFAIYEGVHKLHAHEEVSSPIVGLSILVFGFILELFSFAACLREVSVQNQHGNIWQWFRNSKNSELLVIFTEDAAALVGLLIAAVCLGLAWFTGNSFWDALGSILVGCLLSGVALLLGAEIKSFLIGEAPGGEMKVFVEATVKRIFPTGRLLAFIAIQTGSDEVMMSCKIDPGQMTDLDEAIDKVNELERNVKAEFAALRWQFVELDRED